MPEKVVCINKEKSQRIEALAELQLFRGHSKLDFDTIIEKPECVVNTEKEKYIGIQSEKPTNNDIKFMRIEKEPEKSFGKWLEEKGYDKSILSQHENLICEVCVDAFRPRTQRESANLKSKHLKIQEYNKLQNEYRAEIDNGIINMVKKQYPLDMTKKRDRAYVRMQIKRNTNAGDKVAAEQWKRFYDSNVPKQAVKERVR